MWCIAEIIFYMFINIITFSSLSQQLRHQWSWESLYYTGTSSSGKQRRVFNTFILKIIIAESQQPIISTRISHMSSSPRLRARKKRVWQSHFANMQRRRKKGWFMQVVAFIFLCRNCPCVPFFFYFWEVEALRRNWIADKHKALRFYLTPDFLESAPFICITQGGITSVLRRRLTCLSYFSFPRHLDAAVWYLITIQQLRLSHPYLGCRTHIYIII